MANDTAVKAAARKRTPAKKTAKQTAPAAAPPLPPPGWYTDPAEADVERYWDGEGWDASQGTRRPGGEPIPPPTAQAAARTGGEDAPAPAGSITFHDRVIAINRPTSDQLAVWKMVADRAQAAARELATNPNKPCTACKGSGCDECGQTGSSSLATVLKLFRRAMTIISSILVDEADRDWLEDELIAGRLDLVGASEIVSLAVQQITGAQPAAPRNGPAPKARRRR